jgi:putative acetyltransferase
MHIISERPTDADIIQSITVTAFAPMPYGDGSEGRIVDALRAAGALTLSLVAVEEGIVLGHIAFSPVTIDGREGPWFGLGPVSVMPGRQFEGIGSALIREGLSQLAAKGAEICVLLGNPNYYRRFGFEADPALTCDDGPAEAFQRLILNGEAQSGRVDFHPAFAVD